MRLLLLLGLPLFSSLTAAQALPNDVYVYTGGPRGADNFDRTVEGAVRGILGLVDGYGKPLLPQANGNILHPTTNAVLGQVITQNGQTIGYRTAADANGNFKEAYDVNQGATADQAWLRVRANGQLFVMTHGFYQQHATLGRLDGGGLYLDGRRAFDGFRDAANAADPGTRSGYGAPYPLTARRAADNISVHLCNCWSANDPDGGARPRLAVTTTVATVPGVGAVSGSVPVVTARLSWELSGGTDAEKEAARTRLRNNARPRFLTPAGNPSVAAMLNSFPYFQQYGVCNATVRFAVPSGAVRPVLGYQQPLGCAPVCDDGECTEYYEQPVLLNTAGGDVTWSSGDSFARLRIPAGALATEAMFQPRNRGDLPETAPAPTLRLRSGIYDFRDEAVTYSQLLAPATLTIRYEQGAPTIAMGVWRYDETAQTWSVVPGTPGINPITREVTTLVSQVGVYALFSDRQCAGSGYANSVGAACLDANCPSCPGLGMVALNDPLLGTVFTLHVAGGPVGALSVLLIGPGVCTPGFPVLCGLLHVTPAPLIVAGTTFLTGGTPCGGTANIPMLIPPSPTLCGGTLCFQSAVLCLPQGLGLTNAVEARISDR